jgi:putative flippase GtrA
VRGWQASAVASLTANLNNYILNNHWTFFDRLHKSWRVVKGYFSYLLMTAVGLVVTTSAYAAMTWSLSQISLLEDLSRRFSSFTASFANPFPSFSVCISTIGSTKRLRGQTTAPDRRRASYSFIRGPL